MQGWLGAKLKNRVFVEGIQVAEILRYSSKLVLRVSTAKGPVIVLETEDKNVLVDWLNKNLEGWYQLKESE